MSNSEFEFPKNSPKEFGIYPEIYVESALDFLLFLFGENYTKKLLQNSANYANLLLILICSLPYFKNPYLASKVKINFFYFSNKNIMCHMLLQTKIINSR